MINIEKCIPKLFQQSYTFAIILSFGSHDKGRQQKVQSKCGDSIPFSSEHKSVLEFYHLLMTYYYLSTTTTTYYL